jgi:predicted ATP-grasp superfamily ATP-dependent carboligase
MRLFVYEWTCCTPEAAPSLHCEGWAMLRALLDDLRQVPGVRVVTLLHDSFSHQPLCETHRVDEAGHLRRFAQLARGADGTIVIAPELGQVLLRYVALVKQVGGRLLGPDSKAIALTGAKDLLTDWWHQRGVPTPPLARFTAVGQPVRFPAVLKPRNGAGSTATFLVRRPEELDGCLAQARAEGCGDDWVVQDFVEGQPASVAFLIGPAGTTPLVPAAQHLSNDGRFHYRGGTLPLPAPLAGRAAALGRRAIDGVPGLRGYVGVDLVLGPAEDGSLDHAIEINPRLTTSYLGLRALAAANLAGAWLTVLRGETPALRWHNATVTFDADGGVEHCAKR